jgi:hypothetical protein
MSAIKDGGPAFPGDSAECGPWFGMTLRDYFAAQAMQGMLTRPGAINLKQDAEFAYMLADAMLRAREAA